MWGCSWAEKKKKIKSFPCLLTITCNTTQGIWILNTPSKMDKYIVFMQNYPTPCPWLAIHDLGQFQQCA